MSSSFSIDTERRLSPRYLIDFAVELILSNDCILTVHARNISNYGLQIVCDSWAIDEIEPRGTKNHATGHIRFKAITELPVGEGKDKYSKTLYANCRITSVQRMSQDAYMLNLAFIDFENDSEEVLKDFIKQYEQQKTVSKS